MKERIKQKLEEISKVYPLETRDEVNRMLCENFPYNIKDESDDFYDGMLFTLHLFCETAYNEIDQEKVVIFSLIVIYAWQEKYKEISKEEMEQWELNL